MALDPAAAAAAAAAAGIPMDPAQLAALLATLSAAGGGLPALLPPALLLPPPQVASAAAAAVPLPSPAAPEGGTGGDGGWGKKAGGGGGGGNGWRGGGKGGAGGGGGGTGGEWTAMDWGVPGFGEALHEALEPYIHMEPGSTVEELAGKVGTKITKAAKRFSTDERTSQRGTSTFAKLLIEEFVEACMLSVHAAFYERPWFGKANLSGPLLAVALHTFSGAKVFTRTLAPMLELFVQEGLFKWAEEERISQGFWAALELAGVHENHRKKAKKHLEAAFDEAHMKAPYGSTAADTTEMCMLQDFVKGWMMDFVGRGYDVMQHGIGNGSSTRDEHILFLTVLFQYLTSPEHACLPSDLTALIETPPASPWSFIAECAEAIFRERDAAQKAERHQPPGESKRRRVSTAGHAGKGGAPAGESWTGRDGVAWTSKAGDSWGSKNDSWGSKNDSWGSKNDAWGSKNESWNGRGGGKAKW